MLNKFIGDKKFYRNVFAIAVPMMIQTGITNFVQMLDNIMVGRVGTEEMSGVAIANQLFFVLTLCLFGGVSGAGIFTAQFYGSGNHKGVRDTFRYKVLICIVIALVGIGVFSLFGEELISLYLHEGSAEGDLEMTLKHGLDYLNIMLIGLIPFSLVQAYYGTLRETGETVLPMTAGVVAVTVNLFFNYVFIFGHFGCPAMGAKGAAVATVISRFIELGIAAGATHIKHGKYRFIEGAYKSLKVPKELVTLMIKKGLPILVNEALWSLGVAITAQCYSQRGLAVVAATNIASAIINVCNVGYLSLGSAVGIIVGNLLGAGKKEEAVDADNKLIAFSVIISAFIGVVMFLAAAPFFPMIYNTGEEVRTLAEQFIKISACVTPFFAFTHASYFTLRAGGKTFVTVVFDSGFMYAVVVPVLFCLANFTALPILPLYAVGQGIEIIKSVIGFFLVKKGTWINKIVD